MDNNILSVYALCFVKDMGVAVEVQGLKLDSGSGQVFISGNVGELARDSVLVCKTLVNKINPSFADYDYHMHFQYLNLKKDGPSWGLACFILLSMLCNIKMKHKEYPIAATGELDLKGNIKPVKYIKEKVEGIYSYINCDTIFIPKSTDNFVVDGKKIYQFSNVKELFDL